MDTKKLHCHYPNIEGLLFEEFVYRALKDMDVRIEKSREVADFYLPNGLPDYCRSECYLEVKYTNLKSNVFRFVERHTSSYVTIIVLSLCKNEDFANLDYENVIFLGESYVNKLVSHSPKSWWSFISGCANSPNIKIDYENKQLYLEEFPLAAIKLRKGAYLRLDDIEQLSILNVDSFVEERKTNATSIILGNGVSIPFGSDSWDSMSEYLFDYLTPLYLDNPPLVKKAIGDTTFSCTALSKYLIEKNKFNSAIHQCIYRKYESGMHTSGTLLNEVVLSKIKYPELNIITYNYDCFFENEFKKLTGTTINSVANAKMDKRTHNPKIKHVHGLIPHLSPSRAVNVVLTQDDYYTTYSGENWSTITQKDALNGLTLFVGSSMSDIFQLKLIDEVRNSFYKNPSNKGKIWKCYALLCFKGMSPKDIASVYQYYSKKNIYIIYVDDFSKLASKYKELFC